MKCYLYGKIPKLSSIPFVPFFPYDAMVGVSYGHNEAIKKGYFVAIKTNRELSEKEMQENGLEFIKDVSDE